LSKTPYPRLTKANREARIHLQKALRFKPATNTRLQLAVLSYKTSEFREAVAQIR